MALQTILPGHFDVRAFLVTAALLSLCVADNVGPRFLPLPVVTELAWETPQENQHKTSSRTPAPGKTYSFRVPMTAQMQKRADQEPQPSLAPMLKGGAVLSKDARFASDFSYQFSLFTPASVSRPPGRAPPRLA
jgi:hypothetical protein